MLSRRHGSSYSCSGERRQPHAAVRLLQQAWLAEPDSPGGHAAKDRWLAGPALQPRLTRGFDVADWPCGVAGRCCHVAALVPSEVAFIKFWRWHVMFALLLHGRSFAVMPASRGRARCPCSTAGHPRLHAQGSPCSCCAHAVTCWVHWVQGVHRGGRGCCAEAPRRPRPGGCSAGGGRGGAEPADQGERGAAAELRGRGRRLRQFETDVGVAR